MKDVQEIVIVRLDKDYDLNNYMFHEAYTMLEKQVAEMAEEVGVDIKLDIRYRVEQYGACTRRETYVVMILDTMAIGLIKMITGRNIIYSTGIMPYHDSYVFKWRPRELKDDDPLLEDA